MLSFVAAYSVVGIVIGSVFVVLCPLFRGGHDNYDTGTVALAVGMGWPFFACGLLIYGLAVSLGWLCNKIGAVTRRR